MDQLDKSTETKCNFLRELRDLLNKYDAYIYPTNYRQTHIHMYIGAADFPHIFEFHGIDNKEINRAIKEISGHEC